MSGLVNLTRHVINVVATSGELIDIPPSGVELRVEYAPPVYRYVVHDGQTIEVVKDGVVLGIRNLPAQTEGVLFVASYAAAQYCNDVLGRTDVVCPATANKDKPIKRDGDVIAVRKLRGG